jgi:hypothetical protein
MKASQTISEVFATDVTPFLKAVIAVNFGGEQWCSVRLALTKLTRPVESEQIADLSTLQFAIPELQMEAL